MLIDLNIWKLHCDFCKAKNSTLNHNELTECYHEPFNILVHTKFNINQYGHEQDVYRL